MSCNHLVEYRYNNENGKPVTLKLSINLIKGDLTKEINNSVKPIPLIDLNKLITIFNSRNLKFHDLINKFETINMVNYQDTRLLF